MNVVFKCQHCQTSMQAPPDAVGRKCACVTCGKTTLISPVAAKSENGKAEKTASPTSNNATSSKNSSSNSSSDCLVPCPRCGSGMNYAKNLIGTKKLCRKCNEIVVLPPAGQPAKVLVRPESSIAFECPQCLQLFEGTRDQAGRKGKCSKCATVFQIVAIEPRKPTQQNKKPASTEKPTQAPVAKAAVPQPKQPAPTPRTNAFNAEPELGIFDEVATTESSTPKPATSRPATPKPATSKPNNTRPSTPKSNQTNNQSSASPFGDQIPSQGLWSVDYSDPAAFSNQPVNGFDSQTSFQTNSRQGLGLGTLLSKTFNSLVPTIFYMYLPLLIYAAIVFATQLVLFGIGSRLEAINYSPMDSSPIIVVLVVILVLSISILARILFALYILPTIYYVGLRGAKGKKVSTSDIQIPITMRLTLIGYLICQNFLLAPLLTGLTHTFKREFQGIPQGS